MYTATVQIAINQFNVNPGAYATIDATLSPPVNTSPNPPPPGPPVFSGDGQQITVCVPQGYLGAVQFTFQLPDPNYVLVGIAVDPTRAPDGPSVGRQQFRTITVNRDPSGGQLTVTDSCNAEFNFIEFNYVILVQQVASGAIGIIDPGIDNDPNEN